MASCDLPQKQEIRREYAPGKVLYSVSVRAAFLPIVQA